MPNENTSFTESLAGLDETGGVRPPPEEFVGTPGGDAVAELGANIVLGSTPGVGTAMSINDLKRDLADENYALSALDAVGLFPLMGGVTKAIRNNTGAITKAWREFSQTDVGKRLFGQFDGDIGGEIADALDPEVLVDPKARSEVFTKLYGDSAQNPSRATRGVFSSNADYLLDTKKALSDAAEAVTRGSGVPSTSSVVNVQQDFLDSVNGLAGDPFIAGLVRDADSAFDGITDLNQARTVQDTKAFLRFVQKQMDKIDSMLEVE